MSLYSVENTRDIVRRLLRSEGASSIVGQNFKNLKEKIKSEKDNKKNLEKQLRQKRRELRQANSDTNTEEVAIQTHQFDNHLKIAAEIEELEIKINELTDTVENLEKEWEDTVDRYAKDLLKNIRSKKCETNIDDFILFDKTTFRAGNFETKAIEQFIKDDIATHYKKKPADRNIIIEQLRGLLGNKLPKCIIRADIKSFFESVRTEKLLDRLEEEGFLSQISLYYLREISRKVSEKGVDGVPRGMAFSSYLTEIYLQSIDDEIGNLPNLYFYQRYVDDIVMLFSVGKDILPAYRRNEGFKHWGKLNDIFSKGLLSLHEVGDKKCILYSGKTTLIEFDYLGYKFIIDKGELSVRLSDKRMDGYSKKIEAIIKNYNLNARDNESQTERLQKKGERRRKRQQPLRRLFGQLSALTGNGILKGPKSNILTGVYYSNKYVTSLEDFEILDEHLKTCIKTKLRIPLNLFNYGNGCTPKETRKSILEMLVEKWSFVEGFRGRRFCKNTSYFNRLKQIKRLVDEA